MAYMDKAKTVEWETPQWLFDELNEEFHFTLDAAASDENHKCQRYYTKDQDGLAQDWSGEVVWLNPPYGKCLRDWVRKASQENATTVMLIPARTDTSWFHDYIYGKAEIRFIRGRLKFGGQTNAAPFPNMVVIFAFGLNGESGGCES